MFYDVSQKKKIIEKIKFANSFLKKFRGLMFEKEKDFDYALIFDLGKESRIKAGIHMCFVFFPINVLFLDEKRKVVDIVFELKPWTLNYSPKKKACYIVELPCDKGKGICEGDEVIWS